MLLHDAPLTLREFVKREELPLATIFREVFLFLVNQPDAVLFGAHAVNAYARIERMTQDVDVLSTNAARLAEALRAHLGERFHVAVRVREVVAGVGFRVCQLCDGKNRHLADVRQVDVLPAFSTVEGVRIVDPVELLAMKIRSMCARRGREKGLSDRLDAHRLLNAFPELRALEGPIADRLAGMDDALDAWKEIVVERLEADDEDEA